MGLVSWTRGSADPFGIGFDPTLIADAFTGGAASATRAGLAGAGIGAARDNLPGARSGQQTGSDSGAAAGGSGNDSFVIVGAVLLGLAALTGAKGGKRGGYRRRKAARRGGKRSYRTGRRRYGRRR